MVYNSSNRRRSADETKKKIYMSAEQLFAENEPDKVSVEAIVKSAGVSKGSFYVHFVSKDALFMELVKNKVTMVDAEYQQYIDSLPPDMPVIEAILLLLDRISEIVSAKIGVANMTMIYKAQLVGDEGVSAVASYHRNIYGMFRQLLERGMERGEIRNDIASDVMARHFLLAVRGVTYEWCIRQPDFDYKTQTRAHLKLLLEGLCHYR